jgi:hypothetical protein
MPSPALVTRAPALSRRHFYIGVSLLMSSIAAVGFWPTYFGPLVRGTLRQTPLLQLHSTVFTGWLVLFLAQAVLAVTGHLAWHRLLGRIGIGYGLLLIVIGFWTGVVRSAALPLNGEAERLLFGSSADMVMFTSFFVAAIVYRHNRHLHERLMMVAATTLLIAAVGRVTFLPKSAARLPLFFALWLSPILVAILYDWRKQRRVYPVYLIGLVALAVRLLVTPIVGTSMWKSVAQVVLRLAGQTG